MFMKKSSLKRLILFVTPVFILCMIYPCWNALDESFLNSEPFKTIEKNGGNISYLSPREWFKHYGELYFFSQPSVIIICDRKINDTTCKAISKFSSLYDLTINNTNINDSDISQFKTLKKLRSLGIANTNIGDIGISGVSCPNIYFLQASGTKITDKGLVAIQSMRKLSSLYLNNTKITDAGIKNLKELNELESLGLSSTGISDNGLLNLKNLKDMQKLNLANTQISDSSLLAIAGFKKLRTLNLANTKISDNSLLAIMGLKKLENLNLSNTKISDIGIEHFFSSNPRNLECIDLSGTNITDEGLKNIKKCTSLNRINLSATKITVNGLLLLNRRDGTVITLSEKQINSSDLDILKNEFNNKLFIYSPDGKELLSPPPIIRTASSIRTQRNKTGSGL